MSPVQQRRRPITKGCRVEHVDGRPGIVLDLITNGDGLPEAVVDFEPRDRRQPHTRERLPLGYIVWVGHGAGGP
jgi:hypothetical protein